MGVDVSECHLVGKLIGIKTVANEFIAYRELGKDMYSRLVFLDFKGKKTEINLLRLKVLLFCFAEYFQ